MTQSTEPYYDPKQRLAFQPVGRNALVKIHGRFWPWAFPREGITGSRDWIQPILDMRAAYKKMNGAEQSYTFMRLDHAWELLAAEPATYVTTRRKLAILCVALGDPEGEKYTMRSHRLAF